VMFAELLETLNPKLGFVTNNIVHKRLDNSMDSRIFCRSVIEEAFVSF
jgi:hypothetical protein